MMSSFIIHKPQGRTPFTKAALKTLESIGGLEQFLRKHRKDYIDLHRTTEQERDNIEHELELIVYIGNIRTSFNYRLCEYSECTVFGLSRLQSNMEEFIKACKEQIDVLTANISSEETNSKGWLASRNDSSNADVIAHKHGVVLILSKKLQLVTSQFDHLRGIRYQDAINRAMPRRKLNHVTKSNPVDPSKPDLGEEKRQDKFDPKSMTAQQQLLDDETRALQVELSSLLDAVQETETKVLEMSALNHMLSTNVLQQAQTIELLYDQAVEATRNVELGNKELSHAIQRNSSSRTFLLLFLFVLTSSVLFLDWSGKRKSNRVSSVPTWQRLPRLSPWEGDLHEHLTKTLKAIRELKRIHDPLRHPVYQAAAVLRTLPPYGRFLVHQTKYANLLVNGEPNSEVYFANGRWKICGPRMCEEIWNDAKYRMWGHRDYEKNYVNFLEEERFAGRPAKNLLVPQIEDEV
ncbi:Syntaxin-81-like protein [Drosera capensis]